MAKGRNGEMKVGGGAGGGAPRQRAAYYEDYAKPVIVNWPFMLVAAAAIFVVGHFANRGAGRRLGGNYKKRAPSTEDPDSGSNSSNGRGDDSVGRRGNNQPMSLAELRLLRAEAAEARLKNGATSSSPAAAKPTPLGSILLLARKVDKLEEETSQFFVQVKDIETWTAKEEKEHARLLELLTQVQLAIDGVQSDESVRPHRKTQTNRVQKLITALEGVDKNSR
ncbi:unnamed protein product [Calypogeia fissa]